MCVPWITVADIEETSVSSKNLQINIAKAYKATLFSHEGPLPRKPNAYGNFQTYSKVSTETKSKHPYENPCTCSQKRCGTHYAFDQLF